MGRSRVTMQIDIAFGDSVYPSPGLINYPVILDFPKPRLKGYPHESVVSEKFESMVKLGSLNSRMKDFYDLWIMMRRFNFNGSRLVEALKRTFHQRKNKLPEQGQLFAREIYDKGSDRQTLWKAFLKKGEIKHVPLLLSTVAHDLEKFLIVPLEAVSKGFNFNKKWSAPGPWE